MPGRRFAVSGHEIESERWGEIRQQGCGEGWPRWTGRTMRRLNPRRLGTRQVGRAMGAKEQVSRARHESQASAGESGEVE
jgi:hypothetical protein